MFDRLKRLYRYKKLSENGLIAAVARGWITEEQRQEIMEEQEQQNAN